jgi:hypothetical protein
MRRRASPAGAKPRTASIEGDGFRSIAGAGDPPSGLGGGDAEGAVPLPNPFNHVPRRCRGSLWAHQ